MTFSLLLTVAAMTSTSATNPTMETLTLGGGCFWCIEAVYDEVRGVESAISGYSGGHVANPSYKQVVGKGTGHAEVVEVRFDPTVVSRDQLLDIYFTIHDPTTLNRQGNDVGPQYRSVAFYRNAEQKAAIEAAISRVNASGEYSGKAVTEVVPFEVFYEAEDYHQQYFELNGSQPYCQLVIAPKIAKFRKKYAALLKD